MHSHSDRDDFVKINWENIQAGVSRNFDKVSKSLFGNFGTSYDLVSVMHYGSKSFSKNGKHTIVPKNLAYLDKIGQRIGLSQGDVDRINNMYKCNKTALGK